MKPETDKKIHPLPRIELKNRIRFVTAASLFDGHDASINIMRRILQVSGVEVIHLGHNRSANEIVQAALQEDVQAIAVSSYQGGHVEFFKYLIDLLKKANSLHIKVFGGGGGTITPEEIATLEKYGVSKIYSPEDGRQLGLQGIINDMISKSDTAPVKNIDWLSLLNFKTNTRNLSQALTCIELGEDSLKAENHLKEFTALKTKPKSTHAFVIGFTGTGGAGKSSLIDELVLRILNGDPDSKVAILAIDPTRKKTGGALLGDRLRMNCLKDPRCYMRSFATRKPDASLSDATGDAIALLKQAGFDWILVETGGIGQADTSIVGLVDTNVYVMTSDYGASTQLEKINMLDYADVVILNKFDRPGALDALEDLKKQFRRNHLEFEKLDKSTYPVIGTIASRFADPGVTSAYEHLHFLRSQKDKRHALQKPFKVDLETAVQIVPRERTNYLADISDKVRQYKSETETMATTLSTLASLKTVSQLPELSMKSKTEVLEYAKQHSLSIDPEVLKEFEDFKLRQKKYQGDSFTYQVRNQKHSVPLTKTSLSGNPIRKISLPHYHSEADLFRFFRMENLPGYFPFTAGVFPFKKEDEEPKRMFAGEGTPERTNARFHYLCQGESAKRLSTAFDSVTLYGEDPDERPDIFGKIGESGVNVCTLDDAKRLYAGFDLTDPKTSVSMTINGPAPMLLAFYFNAAIDQALERFEKMHHKPSPEEAKRIRAETLSQIRGTVQADILKEDQAQNTCIFSTPFALKMMGDIQEFFIQNKIRNYYSVSISGYHIAEAGANPISQLAFTLANGFTYLEYYRARKMEVDAFAPNLSFFFSNGLDAEYTVIGRVARRIWAIALKEIYRGNERSQKLKYHIQTSGRSLHAQEISFNDIRTTLQALLAYYDFCNSLHTNAYDEAVTTPTEESVRQAMAIQLIISREFGLMANQNSLQGSFFVEELTQLVEEAILCEFDRISQRGGVLGAMETQYQRNKIQEESLHYEKLKHSGELPIVGVNTFMNRNPDATTIPPKSITRASYEEKQSQIKNLRAFQEKHKTQAPLAIKRLQERASKNENIFEALLDASRHCSLGQMTRALYSIGGEFRRAV